ncbi:MAG: hypothetical protein ACQEXJ_11790 [Myxococcota bacterium]
MYRLLTGISILLVVALAACGSDGGSPGLVQEDGSGPDVADVAQDDSGGLPDAEQDVPSDDAVTDTPTSPDADPDSTGDVPAPDTLPADAQEGGDAGGQDSEDVACVPDCEGNVCGPDGCGGSCGDCACGDGVCQAGESPESCALDCGPCGDGTCGIGEDAQVDGGLACPADCAPECGDGICEDAETPESCRFDCGGCGDGLCGPNDDGCFEDCLFGCGDGTCNALVEQETCPQDCPPECGDGECGATESPLSCPADCATCGDGMCTGGEDEASCFDDCNPLCGDGACRAGDTVESCPEDCGPCGDGVCGLHESPESCPADCAATCGDGTCGDGEDEGTCPADCACLPECEGVECGEDPCGYVCGVCGDGFECTGEGICACVPDCEGRVCGDDGCGGSCGACDPGLHCEGGQCACDFVTCDGGCCEEGGVCVDDACCMPDCEGRECGPDGCGGTCGECPFAYECEPDAGICEWQVFCGNGVCEPDAAEPEDCNTCAEDCGCEAEGICGADGACCDPACDGLECGPDGCGGTCGTCGDLSTCADGLCACDFEACEGACCAEGEVCDAGACCQPSCDGRSCGSDGCGGSCGTCPDGFGCDGGLCECDNGGWARTYGGSDDSVIYAVEPDGQGGFVFAGMDDGTLDDFWVGRTDGSGSLLWDEKFNGAGSFPNDAGFAVAARGDGGLVAGGKRDSGTSMDNGWIRALGPNGGGSWASSYGGGGFDIFYDVAPTPDGNWLFVGHRFSGTSYDGWRVEMSDTGAKVASGTWGSSAFELLRGVTAMSSGGYALAGMRGSNASLGNDQTSDGGRMWVVRVDADYGVTWSKAFGTKSAEGYEVVEAPDGGVVAVGYTKGTGRDLLVVRLDADGNKLWDLARHFGGDDVGRDVAVTDDGHFIVAGYTSAGGGGRNALVVEIDDTGALVWQSFYGFSSHEAAYSLTPIPGEEDRFLLGGHKGEDGWLKSVGRCAPPATAN